MRAVQSDRFLTRAVQSDRLLTRVVRSGRLLTRAVQSDRPDTEPRPLGSGLFVVVALILLTACVHPEDSGVQVIVGAKLDPGPGRAPVDYSVIVVADGKFQAVGPQSSTPVPIGAKTTRGLGMTVEPIPGGEPIEAGRPANLVLKGDHEQVMRNGVWQ